MLAKSNKRNTRIDLRVLGNAREPPKPGSLHRIPEEDTAIDARTSPKSNTTRRTTQDRTSDAVDPTTGLKRLRISEAVDSGVRAAEYIRTQHLSPWTIYEKLCHLRHGLGDWVILAEQIRPNVNVGWTESQDPLSSLVTVRTFSGHSTESKLRMIQQIRHRNIVAVREIFAFEGVSHVVFEHMPLSLSHMAGSPHLNETRLAAILGQVEIHHHGH